MYLHATIYAIPLMVGATVALTFCFLALRRYQEPGALAFVAGMASVALWSFAYAFEIMAPTVTDKLVWHRIIYSASAMVPAFWLLFLIQHEYRFSAWTRVCAILLLIEPIVYTVITWTNGPLHHWLWRSITLSEDDAIPKMIIARSPGFYWHVGYTYVLVLLSVIFFLRMLRRESSTLTVLQMILLVVGIVSPVIANTLHLTILESFAINLTPFSLMTMGAAGGWFAFRFDLWDMLPAAYDTVFANIGDGVVVLNLHRIVIDINPAACRLLELSAQVAIGQPVDRLAGRYVSIDRLRKALGEKTQQRSVEIEITLDESHTHVVDVVVAELRDRRQRINGQIWTLRDITPRRVVELQLADERQQLAARVAERTAELSRANAELAAAARLKDEFLANMSHELRTPLNTILGLSEALQEGIYGILSSPQNRALQHVLDAGRHLLSLINDILDVSKIEAGKFTLELGPVAVDSLCQASVNFVKQEAIKKALTVAVDIDPAVQIVYGDERRLKQILINLLNNAVKFTPSTGRIGLEVRGDPLDEIVYFTVWDTGIGIAEADMAALFLPFVQLDSRLTRVHEGTGLGLTLVHRMVELHGGSVSVASQVDEGSTFTVALPWRPQTFKTIVIDNKILPDKQTNPSLSPSVVTAHEQSFSSTERTMLAPSRGQEFGLQGAQTSLDASQPLAGNLLLIEDSETNIRTFSDFLASVGYVLVVARSGIEALDTLREFHPDLVLLDIQMPGMDGWEVARHIRAIPSMQQVPIIALTALAMPGDRERCFAAGMNGYLSKPVSLRMLNRLVMQHLNKSALER